MVYDLDRSQLHAAPGVRAEWFLMTSGTTLRYQDWISIGQYNEQMEIDYLDHEWSARAVAQGYQLKCSQDALLLQTFGSKHPNGICRRLGINLYSPLRHETALRNLIWMLSDPHLPASFKWKESVKMLFKPVFWLLFEPERYNNARAIAFGFLHGLGIASGGARSLIKNN
jgi:rhamnosyltransferase